MSTLIEKLERESDRLHKLSVDFSHDTRLRLINEALGIYRAIDIVKKHQAKSDWISVDERLLPDNMMVLAYCHIRKTTGYAFVSHQQAWSFYHFTKNSENQALAMVNDISKWMPIPKPPSDEKLTQDVFKDAPDWVRSAAINAKGEVWGYSVKANQLFVEVFTDGNGLNPYLDFCTTQIDRLKITLLQKCYDPTDWQNSAIDREVQP